MQTESQRPATQEDWTELVGFAKSLLGRNKIKWTIKDKALLTSISNLSFPACNDICTDFHVRGLPFDFDTRIIAYLATNPNFEEVDRSLILKAVMNYNPAKDQPLIPLTAHVIKEFRKTLTRPVYELKDKLQALNEQLMHVSDELSEKESYSKSLLKEIANLTAAIQDVLKQSSGKVVESEATVLNAVQQNLSKKEIIEVIKSQNEKIINYFRAEAKKAALDALTGLYNRGSFDNYINQGIQECLENSIPLYLIIIDIDHFKHVNDTHGHVVGDKVLQYLADHSLKQMSETYPNIFCARYGGEEFALVIKHMDKHNVANIAETLRQSIESNPYEYHTENETKSFKITISLGIAQMKQTETTAEQLIQQADQALYKAKRLGRNRVCVAD